MTHANAATERSAHSTSTPPGPRTRQGFTTVELLVAIILLGIGAVGLASTSMLFERQVTLARMQTDRSAALVSAMELVRSIEFDSLKTSSDSVGRYEVSWNVAPQGLYAKQVTLITTGPALVLKANGRSVMEPSVADTFAYQVIKP
jgi:prepilin-type N-terminal cleavage/methylation domain-containing protein